MTADRPSLAALFKRLLGDPEYLEEVRDRYGISYDEPPEVRPMNEREIAEAVGEIASLSWDYEAAHSKEDQLYERFVLHVAAFGPPELAEMARGCLKSKLVKFARHCA